MSLREAVAASETGDACASSLRVEEGTAMYGAYSYRPDEWMRLYWEAAAPFSRAMNDAWTASATAFLPPPWNMFVRAAMSWRDIANAGHETAMRQAATTPRWPESGFTRAIGRRADQPLAPIGIAASPAARRDLSAMPVSTSAKPATQSNVVLINTFVVPIAMEEPFLSWWRLLKPAFSAQPGFVSAKLHRSLDQNERYRFINIAEWESTEAYRAALTSMWSSVPKPTIAGLEWHPALYEVIEEA